MRKTLLVARHEFLATVATKSFVLGIFLPPALMIGMSIIMPLIINEDAPRIEGSVAIIDPTDSVIPAVREYLSPESIAERRSETAREIEEHTPEAIKALTRSSDGSSLVQDKMKESLGEVPLFEILALPAEELEAEKSRMLDESTDGQQHLALVVVHNDAIQRKEGESNFGRYDLFIREKLDDRIIKEIKSALYRAVTDARMRAHGLDPDDVGAFTRLGHVKPVTVTAKGEQQTNRIFSIMLPLGFMVLLMIPVMTGSSYLLTSTIEEKSNRVVEVLLSAVSPLQLMAGKIVGQLGVGFLILALYGSLAIFGLASFALLGFIEPMLFVYLIIFFLITYLTISALLGAAGAAATEIREAQSLQMPLVMMMVIPWALWMPLSRDPNSVLATTLSFLPPISPMIMMLRLCSRTPPPFWQALIAMVIGVATVIASIWAAAKIFRIGLLLHAKAPNYRTLIRWIRES